uniref:hypothetical protein n=1 Tax=Nocardia abscessus TaxID=120957 RepID=UPI0024585EA0
LYWTETGGDLGIVSNLLSVQGTTSSRRAAIYADQSQTPWQTVQFTVGTAPNTTAGSGAVLRCNAAFTEMVLLSVASNGWSLGRITGINGTYTGIGSFAVTIAAGAVIRVVVDHDSVYRVYINGVKSGPSYRDTTWADNNHLRHGLFVQRAGTFPVVNSASLGGYRGTDTPRLTLVDSDDFNRASLGSGWNTYGGGTLYLSSNELCAVGLPSEPISFAFRNTPVSSGHTSVQVVRARVRWNGRNPEHSSMSVALRADPANNHAGAHFWFTATLMGICRYDWDGTGFVAATGTADFVSTSKFAEGAQIELRAEGEVYTASVDSVPVLQGTFTDAQVPLANRYHGIHGEDDSAVSGGGQPPANLDDFFSLVA